MARRKVLYDARHISNPWSGLGRYTLNLLKGMVRVLENVEICVISLRLNSENELYQELLILAESNKIKIVYTDVKPFSLKHYFCFKNFVNKFVGYEYFYPHFNMPFFIRLPKRIVIHDLFPLRVPGYFVKYESVKKIIFWVLCFISLRAKNSECIAISKSTAIDIHQAFRCISNKNIRVVMSSDCLLNNSFLDIDREMNSGKPFLFYVGDRRPHKNIKHMIDIYRCLKERGAYDGDFILAGSEENYDFAIDEYSSSIEGVKLVGKVTEDELIRYYSNMDALFFLSKYEGFGLPILEASRFNKKIITSNVSAMPEVSPASALLMSPFDDVGLSTKIIGEYLNSKLEIDEEDFVNKFSWDNAAKQVFEVEF